MTLLNNPQNNNTDSNFYELLSVELSLLQSLKDLMLDEKKAVEDNQVDKLIPIAEDKQLLLEQVEKASNTRQLFLNKHASGQSGLDRLNSFISQSSASSQLRMQFDSVQEALQDCKNLNDTNAKIIAISQRNVERNLNILKGVDNDAMVYTANGSTEASESRLGGVKA